MPPIFRLSTSGVTPSALLFIPLIILLAAMLAVGCGGSSTSSTSPSASASALSDVAALDLLKRSAEVGESMESGRIRMEIDGKLLGEDFSMSMETDLAHNGWMQSKIQVKSPEGDGKIEQVIAAPDVYTKIEDVTGWLRMDVEQVAAQAGVSVESLTDAAGFSGTLFPTDDIPWDLYTARYLGTEKIDGVQTQHLRVEVDFSALWERLTPEGRQELSQFLGPAQGLLAADPSQALQYEDIEMWIDDRFLAVRTAMAMTMGDTMEMEMDMRLKDYNTDVAVKPPEDYTDVR